jgi:hypothetical protein
MIDEDAAREALVTVAAAERDLAALQICSNAIGNFITGGFLGVCTVFLSRKTGVNAFEAAPFLVIIGIIIFTAIMIWALRGRTAAKPPRLRFAMDLGAAHGTSVLVAFVLTQSLLQAGLLPTHNPVNFASYAAATVVLGFGFVWVQALGTSYGLGAMKPCSALPIC